jgi:hypothetical protein
VSYELDDDTLVEPELDDALPRLLRWADEAFEEITGDDPDYDYQDV